VTIDWQPPRTHPYNREGLIHRATRETPLFFMASLASARFMHQAPNGGITRLQQRRNNIILTTRVNAMLIDIRVIGRGWLMQQKKKTGS